MACTQLVYCARWGPKRDRRQVSGVLCSAYCRRRYPGYRLRGAAGFSPTADQRDQRTRARACEKAQTAPLGEWLTGAGCWLAERTEEPKRVGFGE
jgi:hypothetical protein